MGNDGGSIPDRRDLVRNKPKAEQADKANQTRARWFFCALSKRLLQEPVVSCALGKLYNKDAIIEYLIDKAAYGDGEEICGHIRSLKDVKTLQLTPNPAPKSTSSTGDASDWAQFVCPLTLKEMNGAQPFIYLAPCGCVLSLAGLKALSSGSTTATPPAEEKGKSKAPTLEAISQQLDVCPHCSAKYDKSSDVVTLNPALEEEERMRATMAARRLAEPVKTKSKKRKAAGAGAGAGVDEPPAKKAVVGPSMNPSIAAASRAVVSGLAMEEAKRKAGMSDAVKSLYTSKDGPQRKETFTTMGTFTRYA